VAGRERYIQHHNRSRPVLWEGAQRSVEIRRREEAGLVQGTPSSGVVLDVDRGPADGGHEAADKVDNDRGRLSAEQEGKAGDVRRVYRVCLETKLSITALQGEAPAPTLHEDHDRPRAEK
jgi:hypothetical protein